MVTYIVYEKSDGKVVNVQTTGPEKGPDRNPESVGLDPYVYGIWNVPPEFFNKLPHSQVHSVAMRSCVRVDPEGNPTGIKVFGADKLEKIEASNRRRTSITTMLHYYTQLENLQKFYEVYPAFTELDLDIKELQTKLYETYENLCNTGATSPLPDLLAELAGQELTLCKTLQ